MKLGLPGGMADSTLCNLLLEKGKLTAAQMADVVEAAAGVAAGAKLIKGVRDRLMAIAMAQKLTERTKIKKRQPVPININSDPYSAVRSAGTDVADAVLAMGWRDGRMVTPPNRRTG